MSSQAWDKYKVLFTGVVGPCHGSCKKTHISCEMTDSFTDDFCNAEKIIIHCINIEFLSLKEKDIKSTLSFFFFLFFDEKLRL